MGKGIGFMTNIYNGPLDPAKMTKIAKKAYIAYTNQKSKCENPNNPDFKYYGKKGIKVIYSRREFIAWYLKQYELKKWKDPTTGRLDHDKNYCFQNIELQERKDNSSERIKRLGYYKCDKPVIAFKNGKKIGKYKSATEASLKLNFANSTVVRLCNDNYISSKVLKKQTENGYSFKYAKVNGLRR